mgnify:FL=1
MIILGTNSVKDTGYDVANSVRLDGTSAYLTRTPSSAGNRQKWTWSGWVKRSSNFAAQQTLFGVSASSSTYHLLYFSGNDTITHNYQGTYIETNAKYRDPSAFYHIVLAVDTTQATDTNRIKLYVNGTQVTSFSASGYPSQNTEMNINNTVQHDVANSGASYNHYINGYMAEVCFINNQQLDPTSFGEFDEDSGIWKPIDVSGLTFGTNGFYLDFEDSAALGDDVSGNGNDFTVNNLTAIDQSTDTCTNNFATLNSLTKNNDTALSNGNLTATGTSSGINGTVGSGTIGIPSSGKWYYEIKVTNVVSSSYPRSGLISVDDTQFGRLLNADAGTPGYTTNSVGFFANGQKYYNNSASSFGSSLSNNDIVQWYVDMDNGAVYVGINDTVQNSGNPSSGASKTGAIWTFTAGTYTALMPATSDYNGSVQNFNFGSPPFAISSGNADGNGYGNMEYAIPSGYYVLNTKNLAEFG